MKKKYNPSYKDFFKLFTVLILGTVLFVSTLWVDHLTIRIILVVIGLMLILYSVARIIRIFLKIFLDQIKGWL